MRREELYLTYIVVAADLVAQFLEGLDASAFETNPLVRSAVAHQLTIIGEAVAHLPVELQARYPSVRWSSIKGLRNVIVHNYFGVSWREVWRSATQDAPKLRADVAEIIRCEFGHGEKRR